MRRASPYRSAAKCPAASWRSRRPRPGCAGSTCAARSSSRSASSATFRDRPPFLLRVRAILLGRSPRPTASSAADRTTSACPLSARSGGPRRGGGRPCLGSTTSSAPRRATPPQPRLRPTSLPLLSRLLLSCPRPPRRPLPAPLPRPFPSFHRLSVRRLFPRPLLPGPLFPPPLDRPDESERRCRCPPSDRDAADMAVRLAMNLRGKDEEAPSRAHLR